MDLTRAIIENILSLTLGLLMTPVMIAVDISEALELESPMLLHLAGLFNFAFFVLVGMLIHAAFFC